MMLTRRDNGGTSHSLFYDITQEFAWRDCGNSQLTRLNIQLLARIQIKCPVNVLHHNCNYLVISKEGKISKY